MSFWEKNMEALHVRDDDFYKKIQKLYEEREVRIDCENTFVVEKAKDGTDILGIVRDGRKIMLNSTYRPKDEAEKFVGKIIWTENSITVFFGLGNGQIVSEIQNKINKEATLLVYEPCKELFFFTMEQFDLTPIIEDTRVAFFVGGIDDELFSFNLNLLMNNVNLSVTTLKAHPKYQDLYPEEYHFVKGKFEACRESALTNLNTMIQRNRLMTENAIANIPFLLKSKASADFIGKIPEDIPAIIVSGGPSLDKNYEVLKQAKGKAVIIAMDRTVRFLLDRGIVPDVFCSLDYNKNPELFRDERVKDIPFFYMAELSNLVMNIVGDRNLIYGTGDMDFYDDLIRSYGKQPIIIPVGGSVATFAYGFARTLGFKRTILVGQDLALTGGKVYSGGWVNMRAEAEEYEHRMVPGNVEEMVETRGDFYIYLLWFQNAVQEAKGHMEVINATEGGAKIEGTIVMTLQDAVDQYCTKEYDFHTLYDSIDYIFPQDNLSEVQEILKKRREEIVKLKKVAKETTEAARRCGVLTERGDSGKEFKEKNRLLAKTSKQFEEEPAALLLGKYVENHLLENDIDLYVFEDDNQKEMLRLYEKLEKDYQMIYENVDGLIEKYDSMLEDLSRRISGEEE